MDWENPPVVVVQAMEYALQGMDVANLGSAVADSECSDRELRNSVDSDVELRAHCVDHDKNKFSPEVKFAFWSALKGYDTEIQFPQRVERHKRLPPAA